MHQDFRLDYWLVQPSLSLIRSATEESDPVESRKLSHKVMAVLVCLAERPGEVVPKEELFERVWEGAFTTDEALATVVYELRKVLDDDARNPRYVETIRKNGYRLIASVSTPAEATPTEGRGRRWWTTRVAVPAAATMAAVALAGMALLPGTRPTPVDRPPPSPVTPSEPRAIRSLAVRPLTSFTEECRQDFFAGGLTEMLIADLVFLGPFDVIATAMGDSIDTLRADAILEGSVLRSGDRLWISIQLVDSVGGQILWGGTYERELHDSLDLQLELSREISHQIVLNAAAADFPAEK